LQNGEKTAILVVDFGRKWVKVVGSAGSTGVPLLKGELEQMFLGQFEHSIDEKGRMVIPSRYRDLLELGGAYVTLGFDQNLMVLTASSFKEIAENTRKVSLTDEDARDLKRWIFANAVWVEVDRIGRVLIPQHLRDKARLNTAVVVVGAGDYFEIWAAELWNQRVKQIEDSEQAAKRFSSFDIRL
jgi:MraZ protein